MESYNEIILGFPVWWYVAPNDGFTQYFTGVRMIKKEFFYCYRNELKIRGTVFMPSANENKKYPIAIVSHEFMANQLFSYPYAKALVKCGYAVFCFDFCGGGLVSASEGSSRDMSVMTEIEDLKAVILFAKNQNYTDENTLILMGCSQGGLVSALTAAEMGKEVTGLILLYPALCIPEAARKGEMLWLKFDPKDVPEKMHSGLMRLGKRYATDVMNIDTYQEIAKYTGKVLILHGDCDTIADINDSRKAYLVYSKAGAKAEFQVIFGGKHIFRKPKQIAFVRTKISDFTKSIKK